ncbi:hypothetical protein JZ751_004851 [Albula glossodonta]|uniref:Phosphatidylinositol N-acetylglucosaminyltransferase subunit H conserved domain-containing protein n=1 Tax=Albula glossodonta TaxID=121402 RepID=A0A8T2P460_9TELE|nr:hypothetical protein JZ751_004851 [Albula glossodonta]
MSESFEFLQGIYCERTEGNTAVLSGAIFVTLVGMLLHIHFVKIDQETLLIIGSLGVQLSSSYASGRESTTFIEMSKIKDIVINEAIYMQGVIYYLCILLKDPSDPDTVSSVVPLFQSTDPDTVSSVVPLFRYSLQIRTLCPAWSPSFRYSLQIRTLCPAWSPSFRYSLGFSVQHHVNLIFICGTVGCDLFSKVCLSNVLFFFSLKIIFLGDFFHCIWQLQ